MIKTSNTINTETRYNSCPRRGSEGGWTQTRKGWMTLGGNWPWRAQSLLDLRADEGEGGLREKRKIHEKKKRNRMTWRRSNSDDGKARVWNLWRTQNGAAETTSRFTAAWKGGKNSEKARGKRGHTKCGGKNTRRELKYLKYLFMMPEGWGEKLKAAGRHTFK